MGRTAADTATKHSTKHATRTKANRGMQPMASRDHSDPIPGPHTFRRRDDPPRAELERSTKAQPPRAEPNDRSGHLELRSADAGPTDTRTPTGPGANIGGDSCELSSGRTWHTSTNRKHCEPCVTPDPGQASAENMARRVCRP